MELLQNLLLDKLEIKGIPTSFYLTNGVRLRGTVKGFDQHVVMLKGEVVVQMIYKHAVSTIVPERNVSI